MVRSAGAAEDIQRPWAGALDLIGGVGFDDGRREVEFERAQGRIPPAGGDEGGTVPPVDRGTALKQGANIPRDYRMLQAIDAVSLLGWRPCPTCCWRSRPPRRFGHGPPRRDRDEPIRFGVGSRVARTMVGNRDRTRTWL